MSAKNSFRFQRGILSKTQYTVPEKQNPAR